MALISCPECERHISDRAEVCIGCGCPISAGERHRPSAATAFQQSAAAQCHPLPALLSGVIPGSGQLLKGHTRKAFVIFRNYFTFLALGLLLGAILGFPLIGPFYLVAFGLFWSVLHMRNVIDAYTSNEDSTGKGLSTERLEAVSSGITKVLMGEPPVKLSEVIKEKRARK